MNKTIIIKEDSAGAYYIDENNSRVEMGDSWDKVVDYLEIRAAVHESKNKPKPEPVIDPDPLPWNWYEDPERWPKYWHVEIPSGCEAVEIPPQVLKARNQRPMSKDQARAAYIMHDLLSNGWGNASPGILFGTAYEWGRMNGRKERSRKK